MVLPKQEFILKNGAHFTNKSDGVLQVSYAGLQSIRISDNSTLFTETCSYAVLNEEMWVQSGTVENHGFIINNAPTITIDDTFNNYNLFYSPYDVLDCGMYGGTCLDMFVHHGAYVSDNDGDGTTFCFGDDDDLDVLTKVTFQVDMAEEVVQPEGVHFAGEMQWWDPSITLMKNTTGSIYEVTIPLPATSEWQYKFVNGDTWAISEQPPTDCGIYNGFGGYNRIITVPNQHTILPAVCYGSCSPCASAPVLTAHIRVLLEGPYDIGMSTMNTDLRDSDLLPINQPFARPPWNYLGSESVPTLGDIPIWTTDWVLIELRDGQDINTIVAQRAAFLLNEGILLDVDGTPGVNFYGVPAGSYSIIVRSRNHLANMSVIPIYLPNDIVDPFDFTIPDHVSGGAAQLAPTLDGYFAQIAGDFNSDGVITILDFNFYQTQSSLLNQYLDGDANMDKAVTVADFNLYQPNASVIGVQEVRY